MAEKRKKLPQHTSPAGIFRFPKLSEPDYGNQKFPKPNGEYSVQLLFRADSPEAQALIEFLTPHYEEALRFADEEFSKLPIATRKKLQKVTPNPLYTEVYDKETEEPTGEIFFKHAMTASGIVKKDGPRKGQKWSRTPLIYDAKRNFLKKAPAIWGGTLGKVRFEFGPYFIPGTGAAGLRMPLVGVQLINLVTAGQRSAASMGFGEEEGYEHVEQEAPVDAMAGADEAAGDDGSGDF